MSSAYDTICAAIKTALDAVYAAKNHTHSSYVNPTIADNLTTDDATQVLSAKQGYNLKQWLGDVNEVGEFIGNPLCIAEPIYAQDDDFAFMSILVYASDDGKLCYLKTGDVDADEIATMGDLNSLVGDAITYITGSGS